MQDVKGLITSAFWTDVLTEWSKIHYVSPYNKPDVLAMCIWYNSDIHINNSPVYYPTWHKNGVFYFSDLLNEQGCFYMYEKFCAQYHFVPNILQYYGILSAIPQLWKDIISHNILHTLLAHNWMLKVTIGDDLHHSVYLALIQRNGRYVFNKLHKFESMISEELCNEQYHKLFFNIYKITPHSKL